MVLLLLWGHWWQSIPKDEISTVSIATCKHSEIMNECPFPPAKVMCNHKNHEPAFYIKLIPDFQFFIFAKIMFSSFCLQQGGVEFSPFCSESWDPHSNQDPLLSKTWGTWCRTPLDLQPITNKAIVCNIFNIILTLLMQYYFASAQRVKSNGRCNRASKKSKATWILQNATRMLFWGEYTLSDTWQTKNNLLFKV